MTTVDIGTPIPAADLSLLIFNHQLRGPDPCRVCGHPEMKISSMGGGAATVYVCQLAATNVMRSGMPSTEAAAWSDHYGQSKQRISYAGDGQVVHALLELRALRAAAGDDMTVPVGAVAYPHGHGKYRCNHYLTHTGDDQWTPGTDLDYHDPEHALLLLPDDATAG